MFNGAHAMGCVIHMSEPRHCVNQMSENVLSPGFHEWATNYAPRGQADDWRHTGLSCNTMLFLDDQLMIRDE